METSDLLEKLNEQQREAVLNDDRICMVNASVGSGKTTVLTNKVLYLIERRHVSARDLVVLTFTNKAANEIKERVKNLSEQYGGVELDNFGTFHSVAMRLLKNSLRIEELGFTQDFTLLTPEEEIDLANEIIEEKRLNIKYRNKLSQRIEKYIYGIDRYGVMKKTDDIVKLIDLLQKRKREENQMTFSDLLYYAIIQLNKGYYKAKWIIVDEFQDCDNIQLDFLEALSNSDSQLFVVGDPNQVIYSWRGGSCDVFGEFKSRHNVTELSLPINYRSSSSILDVAKMFLKDEASLCGIRDSGDKIAVCNHYDAFQEAEYIANRIKTLIGERNVTYKDIAIFYRMQKQSKVLEDVFEKNDIPFEVSLKKTVSDIPVLKWFIKLLKFAVNNKDTVSFYDVFCNNEFGPAMGKLQAKVFLDFNGDNDLLNKCRAFKDFIACNHIETIYDYFEIDKNIYQTSSEFERNRSYVIAFINEISKYAAENGISGYDCVLSFLNSSSLYGINLLNKEVNLSANSVKLMTLHSSKGLEFKQVFIIGVNEGYIPMTFNSRTEEEEERRLFFVGITRAKDNLELSYYTETHSQTVYSGPSRYIRMIPAALVENLSGNTQGRSNIFDLKRAIQQNNNFGEKPKPEKERYVHPRYGVGEKVKEDENMITLNFAGYGEKTFYKAFNEVKRIDDQN